MNRHDSPAWAQFVPVGCLAIFYLHPIDGKAEIDVCNNADNDIAITWSR